MTIRSFKLVGAAAFLANSTLALPAQAASFDAPITTSAGMFSSAWSVDGETVNGWRHDRRWRRDRVDGGDVLAGILILGGVVAVAKAVESSKERKYRERDPQYRDYADRDAEHRDDRYRDDPRYADSSRRDIDDAIENCVDEVRRIGDVLSVDTAERDGSGWRVEGDLERGGRYECDVTRDGDVRNIDIDSGRRAMKENDYRDWSVGDDNSDDYYADARRRLEEGMPEDRGVSTDAEEEREWRRGEVDDRYQTSDGPDFALAN